MCVRRVLGCGLVKLGSGKISTGGVMATLISVVLLRNMANMSSIQFEPERIVYGQYNGVSCI